MERRKGQRLLRSSGKRHIWKGAKATPFVAAVAICLWLAGCSGAAAPTATPIARAEGAIAPEALLTRGAELYVANCRACHGDQRGKRRRGASPHNEDGHTWHHPDAQLKEWVLNGKSGLGLMPRFKGTLTESDVDIILVYIKTWWTEEQRQSQADISRRYQEALDD